MDKEIIRLITVLAEDSLFKQVYASEIKMLFDMLREQQELNLKPDPPLSIK
uniref:Uncharacterized protein n=1 Tax=viral metagenome TaxID=1070528 RepID=A0A6M3LU87_9ZZZZ